MTRRRLAAVALVAVLGSGLGATQVARAEPAPGDGAVDIVTARDKYWACLALDHVDVGTCLENPLPDPGGLPSVRDLLGLLG